MPRFRLSIAIAVTGLLLWLIFSEPSTSVTRESLNLLLEQGHLGHLTNQEQQLLESTVKWLAVSAGVQGEIRVNRRIPDRSDGRLSVLTVKPSAFRAVRCAPGNALYDNSVDVILLDEEIVKSEGIKRMLEEPVDDWGLNIKLDLKAVPFVRIYLRFVLLHELAHRLLHAGGGGFLNGGFAGPGAQHKEEEADAFALKTMATAYPRAAAFGIQAVEPNTGNTIDRLIEEEANPKTQVQISMLEMARQIAVGHLILPTPVSPLRDTASHRSYLTRAQSLVRKAIEDSWFDNDLADLAASTNGFLERIQNMLQSRPAEVVTDNPISTIAFDSDGLILLSRSAGRLEHFPFRALEQAAKSGQLLRSSHGSSLRASDLPRRIVALRKIEDGYWVLGKDGEVAVVRSTGIVEKKPALPGDVFWFAESKTSRDCAAALAKQAGKWTLYSLKGTSVVVARPLTEYDAELRALAAGEPQGVEWRAASLDSCDLYFPVWRNDPSATYKGVVRIRLEDLRISHYIPLDFPQDTEAAKVSGTNPLLDSERGSTEVLVSREGGDIAYLLLQIHREARLRNSPVGTGASWRLWRLWPDRAARRMAEKRFLASDLVQQGKISKNVVSLSPRFSRGGISSAPDVLLFAVVEDSAYRVDLGSEKVVTAFHPGADESLMATGRNGWSATSFTNGFKVFAIPPERHR